MVGKVVFIGPLGGGDIPRNGASVKNTYILDRLKSYAQDVKCVDTENWKKNPLVLLRLLFVVLFNRKAHFVLSANSFSAAKILRLLFVARVAKVVYFVIGGRMPSLIKEGKLPSAGFYSKVDAIVVEGKRMKSDLEGLGLTNALTLPNFKNVKSIRLSKGKRDDGVFRFVFLSRIMKEKGCALIFEAIKRLSEKGIANFTVDFYGPVEQSYKIEFEESLKETNLADYKGFLDLRDTDNYTCLAEYDAMLFPTIWNGEGFPGIIIDAYVAGLPVLASDWSMNGEMIDDGRTGYLFAPDDAEALAATMCEIQGRDIADLQRNCFEEAQKYDVETVLADSVIEELLGR